MFYMTVQEFDAKPVVGSAAGMVAALVAVTRSLSTVVVEKALHYMAHRTLGRRRLDPQQRGPQAPWH